MSATITACDPRWATTLPRRVAPRRHEWLPGLLLRCDAANGWPAGSTWTLCGPARPARSRIHPVHLLTASDLDLSRLAALLAVPEEMVVATTFRPSLRQVLGREISAVAPRAPRPRWYDRWLFRICPVCLLEEDTLPQWLALPLLDGCPRHGVRLRDQCLCGASLRPFGDGARPFSCPVCAIPWTALPAQRLTRPERAWTRAVARLYRVLLEHGSPEITRRAATLVVRVARRRKWRIRSGKGRPVSGRSTHSWADLVALVGMLAVLRIPVLWLRPIIPTPDPRHRRRLTPWHPV